MNKNILALLLFFSLFAFDMNAQFIEIKKEKAVLVHKTVITQRIMPSIIEDSIVIKDANNNIRNLSTVTTSGEYSYSFKPLTVTLINSTQKNSSEGNIDPEEVLFSSSSINLKGDNKENLRIVETLNFALLHSTGSYIARMDGDDISLPDRIEKQLQFLKAFPEYDLVGSNTITIGENGDELGRTKMLSNENLINKTLLLSCPVLHIWLAKKEVYIKLKGYRIPTVEDYDFLLRMKTLGLRFTNIDEYLYKVRIRQGNTVSSNGLIQRRCFN